MTAIGEAVHDRLAAFARVRGVAVQLQTASYIGERFLHRLAASGMAETFVLKGGHLFSVWDGDARRPTLDVDLGCEGEPSAPTLHALIAQVAAMELSDGVQFDPNAVLVEATFTGLPRGVRVSVPASLGKIPMKLKVDVTFGQPLVPGPEVRWHYGTSIGTPPARLACAPKETMVTEKLAIAVEFGADNTRMRDYHDLWHLTGRHAFDGELMLSAVRQVFASRSAGTFLTRDDDYWSGGFRGPFATPSRVRAWAAFREEYAGHHGLPEFSEVLEQVAVFAVPLMMAVRDERRLGGWSPIERRWRRWGGGSCSTQEVPPPRRKHTSGGGCWLDELSPLTRAKRSHYVSIHDEHRHHG